MKENNKALDYIKAILPNMPEEWLNLTTHRLDIYNEPLAKTQFLEQFETLVEDNNSSLSALQALPTAYDYIRLGHPLSCVLEWAIASVNNLKSERVICFSSKTAPILAVLRKNLLANRDTQILYTNSLPDCFDTDVIRNVYGYRFELKKVTQISEVTGFSGSTIFISQQTDQPSADQVFGQMTKSEHIDFYVNMYESLGSIILANTKSSADYISEIQHVRRRETIAMTPANCHVALKRLVGDIPDPISNNREGQKALVLDTIKGITGTNIQALVASSGLSMQYAIVMGLVHHALENHPDKAIRIVVPPNCYGGTNDQARRVAACIDQVEVVDLPVDGGNDMARSVDIILDQLAKDDAIPYIIAEIPTNPRVEVPDLAELKAALSKDRYTPKGEKSIAPVFILDQTFCPNVHFLGEKDILSTVRTIAYVSGSKFPSGGKCTAGYGVANQKAEGLMEKIALHLKICDNEATQLQYEILAKQMPSMNQRIHEAYRNSREFVNYIQHTLPEAKINFVSEELAAQGFTPSVFSLDLPTKGNTEEERENYKRSLNLKLINLMITEIPQDSKYCVSYGQLKGCYWTVPATSTQGTTKEGDKDYIARVALAPDMDLELHKKVFSDFVNSL